MSQLLDKLTELRTRDYDGFRFVIERSQPSADNKTAIEKIERTGAWFYGKADSERAYLVSLAEELANDRLAEVQMLLADHAAAAARVLINDLSVSDKRVRQQAAREILDRVGLVKRGVVELEGNITAEVVHVIRAEVDKYWLPAVTPAAAAETVDEGADAGEIVDTVYRDVVEEEREVW